MYQFDHILPECIRIVGPRCKAKDKECIFGHELFLRFIPNINARLFDLAYNIIIDMLQYIITEMFINTMFKVHKECSSFDNQCLRLDKGEETIFNHYTPTITVVPTLKPPLVFDYFVTLNKEFMFINIDSC